MSSASVVEGGDASGKDKQEPQGSDDAEAQPDGPQDGEGCEEAEEQDGSPDDLKVVVSIKGGRATIGVQKPSADPHIETFDDEDLASLTQEVPAVTEKARARWEDAPKHPAYERPAPPARRRNRRQLGTAQAEAADGEAEHEQQQTLRLF